VDRESNRQMGRQPGLFWVQQVTRSMRNAAAAGQSMGATTQLYGADKRLKRKVQAEGSGPVNQGVHECKT